MRKTLLGVIPILIFMWGCTRGNTGVRPPKIIYGEDMCDECKMIINEDKYAAAITTQDNTYRFDDIGCMFVFMSKHSEINPIKVWVHDFKSGEWIDGKDARYLKTSETKTPMGYGILAFKALADAKDYTKYKDFKLLTYTDLIKNPPKEMMNMQGGMK